MQQVDRPLAGLRVGLSVAGNPEELAQYGFTLAGMNRFTVRLARALFAEGANLGFGHDWRPEGVMETIASLAFDYCRPLDEGETQPAILNLVPWPADQSNTHPELLLRLKGTVEVRPAGLPSTLTAAAQEALGLGPDSDEHRYVRARGLSHLRRQLDEICDARVAFGGKLIGFDGRLPGIVEEAVLALHSHKPVYLAGLLGGAARALGGVLLGREEQHDLFKGIKFEALYREQSARQGDDSADRDLDPEMLLEELKGDQLRESLLDNGLSETENRRLLESTLEEEAVFLIIKGLRNRRKQSD